MTTDPPRQFPDDKTGSGSQDGILGAILAGGQARRLNVMDKCLVDIHGRTVLSHIIERLYPQVDRVVLNANGDPARFAAYPVSVIADSTDTATASAGPVAGLLAALMFAEENRYPYLLTVPGDSPLLPISLASMLQNAMHTHNADCVVVNAQGQRHPVFALWKTSAAARLRNYVCSGGYGLWKLQDRIGAVEVCFPTAKYDPFMDIDTPEELAAVRTLMTKIKE